MAKVGCLDSYEWSVKNDIEREPDVVDLGDSMNICLLFNRYQSIITADKVYACARIK